MVETREMSRDLSFHYRYVSLNKIILILNSNVPGISPDEAKLAKRWENNKEITDTVEVTYFFFFCERPYVNDSC